MKCIQVLILGKVQGVFFRKYTQKTAISLQLTGWVRNRLDGSVELQALGSEEGLRQLIQWCHKGSPMSNVQDVIVEWDDCQNAFISELDTFEIRPTI